MQIPNADQGVIDPAKLYGYLLAPSHPIGRFKAAFLLALGYSSDNWRGLEADLRSQHLPTQQSTGKSTRSALGWKGRRGFRRIL